MVIATFQLNGQSDCPHLVDFIGPSNWLATWIWRCEAIRQPLKAAGFSFIEVLVATAIVTVGVASLGQLFVVSARANRIAAASSMTLLLAGQRMEVLLGEPASSPSAPGALSASVPGDLRYVEYLDPSGVSLGITTISLPPGTPPPGTAYICRWSIEPLAASPVTAFVVQVLVTPWPDIAGQTRLVGVKTRKAR